MSRPLTKATHVYSDPLATNPRPPLRNDFTEIRTNNIRRHRTSTAEPRHNMGRTQHRQTSAGERVRGSLNHSGPDQRVAAERWSDPSTSIGASAISST